MVRLTSFLARYAGLLTSAGHASRADGVGKSTIVTSLIKESFVPRVRPYHLRGWSPHSLQGSAPIRSSRTGSAHRPRSHYSARGHPGECDDVYCRLWQYVSRSCLFYASLPSHLLCPCPCRVPILPRRMQYHPEENCALTTSIPCICRRTKRPTASRKRDQKSACHLRRVFY